MITAWGIDGDGLSPTRVSRIELACDRFEAAWKDDHPPRIEDYWREIDGQDLLRELLVLDLVYRNHGQDRAEPADYLAVPAFADAIRSAFESAATAHEFQGLGPWRKTGESKAQNRSLS